MPFDPPNDDQLALLHARGQLVPFVGSGLSMGACVGWRTMVERLERAAGLRIGRRKDSQALVRRAFRAVTRLKRTDAAGFPEQLRAAVEVAGDPPIPEATRELAKLEWPLIVTTNYDDLLIRAVLEAMDEQRKIPHRRLYGDDFGGDLLVCGRDLVGRRRVVDQMDFASGSVLWTVQGLLAPRSAGAQGRLRMLTPEDQLEAQLVVGHAEYREVTWQAPGFRRVFSELYRRKSLLFVGSGLAEPYLQELLGETLQLVGPGRNPHFALVRDGELDPDFLQRRFNIVALPYRSGPDDNPHAHFLPRLRRLMVALRRPTVAQEVRSRVAPSKRNEGGQSQFVLSRSPLPTPDELPEGHWLAYSCGLGKAGRRTIYPSSVARDALGDRVDDAEWDGQYNAVFGGDERLRAVVARDGDEVAGREASSMDRRSPGAVRAAFSELMALAQSAGVTTVHTQLVGAGRTRVFEPWISLAEMARAFGRWGAESPTAIDVVVHGTNEGVWRLVWGSYLDLGELLQATELRLTIELDGDETSELLRVFVKPEAVVAELAARLDVPLAGWTAEVRPRPTSTAGPVRLEVLEREGTTVERFGLVPGGTLVLRREAR